VQTGAIQKVLSKNIFEGVLEIVGELVAIEARKSD